MRRFKNVLIVATAVLTLAVIGTLMNSRQPLVQAAGGPTFTIDPTQLPLPVIGNVVLAGTPFQTSLCETGASGTSTPPPCGVPDHYTVPSGQRLVIEFVSGTCLVGPIGGAA